jgi:hypothetical protein
MEVEMGGIYRKHGGDKKCIQNLYWKPRRQEATLDILT